MLFHNREVIFISIFLITLLLISGTSKAQSINSKSVLSAPDTSKTENKPGDKIILEPVVGENLYYDSSQEVYRVQNGIFLGRSHFGVETNYTRYDSDYYGSFFLGIIKMRETGASYRSGYAVGGFAYGREFLLNRNQVISNTNKPEFYFRAGPGVGIATKGFVSGSETEYYFGVHTSMMLGAQFSLSDRTSIFMNTGGRLFWFPGLNEVGMIGMPIITLGLQFSTSPSIPMLRY